MKQIDILEEIHKQQKKYHVLGTDAIVALLIL